MTDFDGAIGVVAVGASAGGVEALTRLTAGLTPDLRYAVASLEPGSEYVPAPDRHLLLNDHQTLLAATRGAEGCGG